MGTLYKKPIDLAGVIRSRCINKFCEGFGRFVIQMDLMDQCHRVSADTKKVADGSVSLVPVVAVLILKPNGNRTITSCITEN